MRILLATAICTSACAGWVAGQGEATPTKQRGREQAARVSDEDRKFWAFAPLRRVSAPTPKDAEWARNPIDYFIRAGQERHGIEPNPRATSQTLYRRASFGLTGLPPGAEALAHLASRPEASAWAKAVDGLLSSPHYGERWGRHWLDVARFAESHGFEQDYNRPHAFHYRDFVIQALNQDLPFDDFVRWQIAGDELSPDQALANMATGFLGAGVFPTQLTEKEFESARYGELDDMVATIGASMLGLSIGCARCHDHKYDPLPAKDYYSLLAAFSTTIRSEIDIQMDPAADRAAQKAWDAERARLVTSLDLYEREELPKRLAAFLASDAAAQARVSPGWRVLAPTSFKSIGGASAKTQADKSVLVTGKNPRFDTYKVELDVDATALTALRIEAMPDASMPRRGPGRAVNGNFCLTNVTIQAAPRDGSSPAVKVPLATSKATFSQRGLPVAAVIDANRKSGWAVDPQFGKPHAAVLAFTEPVSFAGGVRLLVELDFQCNTGHNIGRPRFSVTNHAAPVPLELNGPPPAVLTALSTPAASRSEAQGRALLEWFRGRDTGWLGHQKKIEQHAPRASTTTKVMICSEGHKPIKHHADGRGFPHFYESVHFLNRGDTTSKGPVAKPGFPQILVRDAGAIKRWQRPRPDGAKTSHRRAAVARWLTDTRDGAGALLARVIVNRLWHHHLGTGIVSTPNDFGSQGARPTHPDLLDWLAGELIRGGWRLKPIHRLIMTSATYQQGDRGSRVANLDEVDKWFGRYRPRRLEAESLRDALLQVSGTLDRRMFGAGTLDESNNRRSIYFMVKRSKLIPMMVTFDLPEPLTSQGRRTTTTVAPQALLLMNSHHVRRYAAAFAKIIQGTGDPISNGYLRALGRAPSAMELQAGREFIASQADSYRESKSASAESLALSDFCQVLFGLNEFAYVH